MPMACGCLLSQILLSISMLLFSVLITLASSVAISYVLLLMALDTCFELCCTLLPQTNGRDVACMWYMWWLVG